MTEHVASRTLVKSPPELWAECSDAASLARHLDQFGEIRITRLDPETAVAWEGERARGTVRIEPAGWGTKVILTAVEVAGAVPAEVVEAEAEVKVPEVVELEVEPEPPPEVAEPEVPEAAAVDADAGEPDVAADPPELATDPPEPATDPPARRRRFARLRGFFRGPEAAAGEPDALVPEQTAGEPEPPLPAEPAPEPVPARHRARPQVPQATAPDPPATDPEPPPTEAALTAALDSLGQAHHRPYSRA